MWSLVPPRLTPRTLTHLSARARHGRGIGTAHDPHRWEQELCHPWHLIGVSPGQCPSCTSMDMACSGRGEEQDPHSSCWAEDPPQPRLRHRSPGPGPVRISLSGSSQGSLTHGSSSCLIHDKKSCAVIRASAPAGKDGDGDSGPHPAQGEPRRQPLQKAPSTRLARPAGGAGLTCAGVRGHPPVLPELLLPHERHLLLDPGQDVGGGDQRLCSQGETWRCRVAATRRGPAPCRGAGNGRGVGAPLLRPRCVSLSRSGDTASNTPGGAVRMGDHRTSLGTGGHGTSPGDG